MLLPLLDAAREVAAVANQYEADTPLARRWGLYQGGSLGKSARDAYARELDGALVSAVAARFGQRLIQYSSEPDKAFEYLKAYLMLGNPDRLDPEQLAVLADYEWQEAYASNPDARDRLSAHFHSLLESRGRLRPVPLDERLVAQARSAIRQASIPRLIYGQLKLDYGPKAQGGLRLDISAGLGADQALRRKSGIALAQPIPPLYTKPVFLDVTTRDADVLVQRYAEDRWVWGDDGELPIPGSTDRTQLKEDVLELYEQDYIDTWEKVLADVEVVPFPNVAAATRVLSIVAGSTSPLRGLLRTVDEHTFIVPPSGGGQPGAERSVTQDLKTRLDSLLNKTKEAVGISTVQPGTRITNAFARIHQLVAGDPGNTPLDRVLQLINQIQQQLLSVGTAFGQTSPVEALAKSGRGDLVTTLRQDAQTLPPVVGDLVSQIGGRAEAAVVDQASTALEQRYRTEVVSRCAALVDGKYPFVPNETEVTIADFSEVFGYGGLFDRFFTENLQALVDTSRPTWAWRLGNTGASLGVGQEMLRQFQRVQAIREMFFPPGSRVPQVGFGVTPVGMDTTVQRFVLEIDGARVEYQFGPERTIGVKWPGAGPGGAATFEARSGNRVIGAYQTAWGWFRLLDIARVQPETSTRYVLTFENGGARASVRIDADRASNPFAKQDLRQFRCA
jgi:type VI secretion system protein ImpL